MTSIFPPAHAWTPSLGECKCRQLAGLSSAQASPKSFALNSRLSILTMSRKSGDFNKRPVDEFTLAKGSQNLRCGGIFGGNLPKACQTLLEYEGVLVPI